jgi:hypothetical protein
MSEHHGNVSKAAGAAQKRRDFGKLPKRHLVDPEPFRVSR